MNAESLFQCFLHELPFKESRPRELGSIFRPFDLKWLLRTFTLYSHSIAPKRLERKVRTT